jgi:hypothetical protein
LLADFGAITITLTSHNSAFETDDNWNIQTANIIVSGPGGSALANPAAGGRVEDLFSAPMYRPS